MVRKPLSYLIFGRGRWARRMASILQAEGKQLQSFGETRRAKEESPESYAARITEALRSNQPDIALLCVPPGEHVATMLECLLEAKVHGIVEQPWLASEAQSCHWAERAKLAGCLLGVHYEYCFLSGIQEWRRQFAEMPNLVFGGVFHHSRSGHLGFPALSVLGTHLLSLRAYAVPHAAVGALDCGYELANQRAAWLEYCGRSLSTIDFLHSREPVIQRYIAAFESAMEGAEFAFDLEFAFRVAEDARRLAAKQGAGAPVR